MKSYYGAQPVSTVDTAYTPCVNMGLLCWDVWRSQEKKRQFGISHGGTRISRNGRKKSVKIRKKIRDVRVTRVRSLDKLYPKLRLKKTLDEGLLNRRFSCMLIFIENRRSQ